MKGKTDIEGPDFVSEEANPALLRQISELKVQIRVWRTVCIVLVALMILAVVVFFIVDIQLGIHDAEQMQQSIGR